MSRGWQERERDRGRWKRTYPKIYSVRIEREEREEVGARKFTAKIEYNTNVYIECGMYVNREEYEMTVTMMVIGNEMHATHLSCSAVMTPITLETTYDILKHSLLRV